MFVFDLIDKIRQKSEDDRKKILLFVVGIIMVIVVVVWFKNINFSLNSSISEESSDAEKSISPFSLVINKISNTTDFILNEVRSIGGGATVYNRD